MDVTSGEGDSTAAVAPGERYYNPRRRSWRNERDRTSGGGGAGGPAGGGDPAPREAGPPHRCAHRRAALVDALHPFLELPPDALTGSPAEPAEERRMLDPKTADQALQTYVRPQTFPVAVRMLKAG